ncbi:MAG TPA: SUMF1/EgtB/PvdO family nonheme iron enzyme [Candidatus Angelobacter sp.]|nr:SUMF1/EgtB/PvdO family nonheme iron enzyme [Candidatus Angelobacter sp.]
MPAPKQEPRYDVFISYRRGAADELAMLLQTQLENHGLSAFLDLDLPHGAIFDDMLLRRIAESPSFLIILTPNALDRCADEEDWVRKEIVQAISSKRNIIPLKVGSFQFSPEVVRKLDPAIRELSRYNLFEYSRVHFKFIVKEIVESIEEHKAEHKTAQETEAAEEELLDAEIAEKQREEQQKLEADQLAAERVEAQRQEQEKLKATRLISTSIAPGTVKIYPNDGQKYVWIPPGTFQMGYSAVDSEFNEDEKPAHSVTITKGFWLGQTPVTQAAYQRMIGANPSHFRGKQLPVESVTWNQAKAYCEAIGGRLPTEAEWEYAARVGSHSYRHGDVDTIAWYDKNSGKETHQVGLKQPNEWNLYDMVGNVGEWVGDWYDEDYYKISPSADPTGPPSGQYRVIRGGSCCDALRGLRPSARSWDEPGDKDVDIGFRCVLEVLL